MNWSAVKDFLKPTKSKIILAILFAIIGLLLIHINASPSFPKITNYLLAIGLVAANIILLWPRYIFPYLVEDPATEEILVYEPLVDYETISLLVLFVYWYIFACVLDFLRTKIAFENHFKKSSLPENAK